MSDLFEAAAHSAKEPLAARMRPRNLDEYIGQDHIVGKGRLLRRAIAADQLSSVIFYGPPGCGKTTLARVIANHTKSNFITLNAVLTGVADIRQAIKKAEEHYKLYNRRTILFVDEVHRWNRAQQDALLPWVENGTIILIGATTENPFFEVNKALVSRSRVFQLKALTRDDLVKAASMALSDKERGYGHWNVQFEKGALDHLIDTANGDARSLLNALELAVETTPEKWEPEHNPPIPAWGYTIYINKEAAEESIQKKVVLYDRDGDYHYDIISAFIKSLRGRDPDAAMYWLARMVHAGEDPDFIFRRMIISACEDTGLADPYAISVVTSCAEAFDRVGMPEGRYHLAHAALYLATAPKSNSSMAFFDALSSVQKEDTEVPNHLRDSSRDAEGFGHGSGYLYPHAYRDHWVAQQYLPDALVGRVFYTPSNQGYEKTIRQDVLSRREIQIAQILGTIPQTSNAKTLADSATREKSEFGVNTISDWWINTHFKSGLLKKGEQLTFSPVDAKKESTLDKADNHWKQRIDTNKADVLLQIRDTMTSLAVLLRHHRSLIWNADDGLLIWDIARKTPEGLTCGVCRNAKGKEILEQYGRTLGDLDKPLLTYIPQQSAQDYISPEQLLTAMAQCAKQAQSDLTFDRLFLRNPVFSPESLETCIQTLSTLQQQEPSLLSPDWCAVIAQRIPSSGQLVSRLIKEQILNNKTDTTYTPILDQMEKAEAEFFCDTENPLFAWNAQTMGDAFTKAGFAVTQQIVSLTEKRHLTPNDIQAWFTIEKSAYGSWIAEKIGIEQTQTIANFLLQACNRKIFDWTSQLAFYTVSSSL